MTKKKLDFNLEEQLANLTLGNQAKQKEESHTKFVLQVPMYVSVPEDDMNGYSSDESEDGRFKGKFDFDTSQPTSFPYRTFDLPTKKSSKGPIEKRVGTLKIGEEDLELDPNKPKALDSKSQELLDLLADTSFEEQDKDHLSDLGVVIGLNRPKSLSTRKNNSLDKQLQIEETSDIIHDKFAFFWNMPWTKQNGNPAKYDEVRDFYKQLKRIDPKKAVEFLDYNENKARPSPPYQQVRDRINNHDKTREIVQELGCNDGDDVYASLIDGDTLDFNGIYSAYLRITKTSTPTIMSTGYEFSGQDKDFPFKFASMVDRDIRIITARHVPAGVYYPEPNTCILIPSDEDSLPESFVDQGRKKSDLESAIVIRNVLSHREDTSMVFIKDKPLITTTPPRAKLTKAHKTSIPFSTEFSQGASPTKDDIRSLKQISQSHFHEKVWYDNLFINGSIKVTGCTQAHCISLLSKIRKGTVEERAKASIKLKNHIPAETVDAIANAATEIRKYCENLAINYVRSENESKLLETLQNLNISINSFSRDQLLILAREDVLEMIIDETINPIDLIALNLKSLKILFDNAGIIEGLQEEDIDLKDLLKLHRIAKKHKESFDGALDKYLEAIERGDYASEDILEMYEQDPLHLLFMSSDPSSLVLENSDDERIIKFALDNPDPYDTDFEWVRDQLSDAGLMDFDRILGNYDYISESDTTSLAGDYEDYYHDA